MQPRLWLADVAPARDTGWIARHLEWLSSAERSRLDRIGRAERRAQLLAGHVLLRRLVADAAGGLAAAVAIDTDADGRPRVTTPTGWSASLAHSGQWVAALLETGPAAPGVDIERPKPQRDIRAIVRVACGLDTGSADEAYLVWAQHEAQLKAERPDAPVWTATWQGHAVAACAGAQPAVALADLAGSAAARALELAWTARPRLPAPLATP